MFRGQRPQSPLKLNKGIEVTRLPPRLVRSERVLPPEVAIERLSEVDSLRAQVRHEFREAGFWRVTG